MKLNVGCGHDYKEGWVNLDRSKDVKADLYCELDRTNLDKFLVIEDNICTHIYMSHILEHINNPLPLMQELHRVAAPDCPLVIRTPYGSSDNAWEDPTHVRPYFIGSFDYFSQAAYGGADYGYRGDWETVERTLILREGTGIEQIKDNLEDVLNLIMVQRNLVDEIQVVMRAVKPIREAGTFMESAPINFKFPA
jgi:ubiquinone/menaquinone biosynthesis C-methylase UbiE